MTFGTDLLPDGNDTRTLGSDSNRWKVKGYITEEQIGIVQKTNTATQNIDAGSTVIWKGESCIATSAIASGETLSSSNLTVAEPLGKRVEDAKYWHVGDEVYLGRTTWGVAYSTTGVRFVVHTEKQFPSSGIAFTQNFSPSSFRNYTGTTVTMTVSSISAEGNQLHIVTTGSGFTTGMVYTMFLNANTTSYPWTATIIEAT